MADSTSPSTREGLPPLPQRSTPSSFEELLAYNPPILESLFAQLSTQSIFNLYHTSFFLRSLLQHIPSAWRYISWRLHQPTTSNAVTNNGAGDGVRQSSNYALDQILIYIVNPFSRRLVSLELDNTAVSGGTLTQTVLILRRDTLQHVSVRGCKNVSLKYHINPWLQMHALARERPNNSGPSGYENLALRSLYTYRCRHHRRRPYLPSSLTRKESDSEPTHELVQLCHKLGIWTDTAWCTSPGARCYRRRGYVTMRVPQDPREVWVVFDRLWRSRNWLGTPGGTNLENPYVKPKKRKRDCRVWEMEEEAENGEALGTKGEGKSVPAHLRQTHRRFVEDVTCDNCSVAILERCEQCSVLMHCTGCRKTLCASCAFDRPFLRNQNAPEEERNKFWWAPGCAVSPCSMQDQDPAPGGQGPPNPPATGVALTPPMLKLKWCCTEPVFSGGGGITFGGHVSGLEADKIRAAPLQPDTVWKDQDFGYDKQPSGYESPMFVPESSRYSGTPQEGPAGRWSSLEELLRRDDTAHTPHQSLGTVPRLLCDECYNSEQWKVSCKACVTPLCLRHDVREKLKVRICGYRDLAMEKQSIKARQKALKMITSVAKQRQKKHGHALEAGSSETRASDLGAVSPEQESISGSSTAMAMSLIEQSASTDDASPAERELRAITSSLRRPLLQVDQIQRPISAGSNDSGPPSRPSTPSRSAIQSSSATPEPASASKRSGREEVRSPYWRGCQSFFCPAIRTPGDHRRRCTVSMRQCTDCKVYACSDCSSSMEPSCRCPGCRLPQPEAGPIASTDLARFFCPNCRFDRMQSGKCRRKIKTQQTGKKAKSKKSTEERRTARDTLDTNAPGYDDNAIEGLAEFFAEMELSDPNSSHALAQPDIRQLEDMGALARDLIRRIQRLREQFPPGSLAAIALPDIRLDDDGAIVESANGNARTTALTTEQLMTLFHDGVEHQADATTVEQHDTDPGENDDNEVDTSD